jgi:hypothetical protein
MEDPCIIQDTVDRDPECGNPTDESVDWLADDFWRIRTGDSSNRHWARYPYRMWTWKPPRLRDLTPTERLLYGVMAGFHRPEPKVASQPWKNQRKQRKCDTRPFKY